MMAKKLPNLAIAAILFGMISGCSTSGESVVMRSGKAQGAPPSRYTTAFPGRQISNEIKTMFDSVKRITSTGIYRIFFFEDSLVTLDEINQIEVGKLASSFSTRDESVAGTAISIAQNQQRTVLLTCAHIIHFPDTLLEFEDRNDLPKQTYVQSMAVKIQQRNFVFDLPNITGFEILDINVKDDLALIQFSAENGREINAPPLPVRMGDSRKLDWGSFIFILGYPKGFPMLTRGIVSSPNRTEEGDFLTDALFNPGISGGMILASRDNFTSFEWVGMANTSSAESEILLAPAPSEPTPETMIEPYTGTVFMKRVNRISYGITQAIPTSEITGYLQQNKRFLRNMTTRLPGL